MEISTAAALAYADPEEDEDYEDEDFHLHLSDSEESEENPNFGKNWFNSVQIFKCKKSTLYQVKLFSSPWKSFVFSSQK